MLLSLLFAVLAPLCLAQMPARKILKYDNGKMTVVEDSTPKSNSDHAVLPRLPIGKPANPSAEPAPKEVEVSRYPAVMATSKEGVDMEFVKSNRNEMWSAQEGRVRATFPVGKDFYPQWKKMSDAEKAAFVEFYRKRGLHIQVIETNVALHIDSKRIK